MTVEASSLAALERLIKETEFENSKLLNHIDEEKQKANDLSRKILNQNQAVASSEKSIKSFTDETDFLNCQFKQNKEVSASLRTSTQLVDTYIEGLRFKLDEITNKNQEQSEKHATMIANYTSKWRAYEEKWKNQPLANEVENIKKQAFDIDIESVFQPHPILPDPTEGSSKTAIQETMEKINELKLKISQAAEDKKSAGDVRRKLIETVVKIATSKIKTNNTNKQFIEKKNVLETIEKEEIDLQQQIKELDERNKRILNEQQMKDEKEKCHDVIDSEAEIAVSVLKPCRLMESNIDSSNTNMEQREDNLPPPDHHLETIHQNKPRNLIFIQAPQLSFTKKQAATTTSQGRMPGSLPQIRMPITPKMNCLPKLGMEQSPAVQGKERIVPALSVPARQGTPSFNLQMPKSKIPTPMKSPNIDKNELTRNNQNIQALIQSPSMNAQSIYSPKISKVKCPPQRDEKEPNTSLKSDTLLMKAPTRGSPGSKKFGTVSKLVAQKKLSPPSSYQKAPCKSNLSPSNGARKEEIKKQVLEKIEEVYDCDANDVMSEYEEGMNTFVESSFQKIESKMQESSTVDEHMPKDKEYTVPMEQANDYTKETTMFGSPFQICLDRHEENKRKFTKSPGDGFHMASRPMFQSEFAEQSQTAMKKERQDGFLASSSFMAANSFFTFGDQESNTQNNSQATSNSPNGYGNESSPFGNSLWSNASTGSTAFQPETSNGFSLFGNAPDDNNQGKQSPGFNFSFASKSPRNNTTGSFSLF